MKGKDLAPSVVAWVLGRAGTFIHCTGGPVVPAFTYARMSKNLKSATGVALSPEALRRIVAAKAPNIDRKRKASSRVSKSYLPEAAYAPGAFSHTQEKKEEPSPAEGPDKQVVSRAILWAVARAARVFHRRTVEGRIGSEQHVFASGELEKALANIPQEAWRS